MTSAGPRNGMVRYLSYDDTARLDIHMRDVVPVFEEAYRIVATGLSTVPGRFRLVNPPLSEGQGLGRPWSRDLRIIPGILPGMGTACRLGAGAVGYGNGVLLVLWDFETMAVQCVISDELVHGVRSAAPNGVFAKHLARPDSAVLAMIGTGRIARWAAEAVVSQMPIDRVRVFSRDPRNRETFCAFLAERLGVTAIDCSSSDEAVEGADIVAMATTAQAPVINGALLRPGATVIVNRPEELDVETARRAGRIVATSASEAEHHVPPYQAIFDARREGRVADGPFDEISEVVAGAKPGRRAEDEIIVCLNAAHGAHDVAAARFAYDQAVALGLGTLLPT